MRVSWEKYALDIARTAAQRSEDIYKKVGACALNSKNMIVAVGYNGLAPGKDVSYQFFGTRTPPGPNCLSLVKRGEVNLLACTLLPCSSCATMIAAYGVKKVVYEEVYHRDVAALDIFDFYGIDCVKL